MTDRLEEIKQSFENGDYVDFSEDVDWLISEVELLRAENKRLKEAIESARQVKGY